MRLKTMNKTLKKLLILSGVVIASVALGDTAFASTSIDVSNATGTMDGDGQAAISAIGASIMGMAGIAIGYKWAKGAIFG